MHRRHILRAVRLKQLNWDRSAQSVLVLAALFLVGSYIGVRLSGSCDPLTQAALDAYLNDFCIVMEAGEPEISLSRTVALYSVHTGVVFLLGFSSLGVLLIPLLSAGLGFGATYTAACFVQTFDRSGIFPAMALLLPRLLFTLTTFLLLAGEAVPQAARIAWFTMRKGKCGGPVLRGKRYFVLFCVCLCLLLVGACFERAVTPILFRLAMEQVD